MREFTGRLEDRQEYWRQPAVVTQERPVQEARFRSAPTAEHTCQHCGTEFVIGSRYCHVCGSDRNPSSKVSNFAIKRALDFQHLQDATGLSAGSLIAFFIGAVCLLAAIVSGLMYKPTTLVDWQAIQTWRIEWMLAAVASFCGGMQLKKS